MNIMDSCIWMEYFNSDLKDGHIKNMVEDHENQFVPAICLYEVYRKFLITKGESTALRFASFMQKSVVVEVTPGIALLAARLGREFKLPMADSIIYATAKMSKSEFYTQDRHFAGLDGVRYFAKSTGGAA